MPKCLDCGGELVGGEPLNATEVWVVKEWGLGAESPKPEEGPRHWIEYRCRECYDQFGRDLWDEDERGPFPDPWPMAHHTTSKAS